MDPDVQALLDTHSGVLSPSDALRLGISRAHLTAAVKAGSLLRLRRGVLIDAALWDATPPWDRHALRARAVAQTTPAAGSGGVAFSHHSALCLQGVGVFGVDERVHLLRTDGGRVRTEGLVAGHPPVDAGWAHVVDGIRVVRPALAAVQVAALFGVEAGLVSADAALRQGAASGADLALASAVPGLGPRSASVRYVVETADARRESAGESRSWWLFHTIGLPEPELQVDIVDRSGVFIGRSDFYWREARVIGEFDGALKYESPAALQAEKWRQDRFGDEGYEVFRLGWPDFDRPRLAADRARRAFARAAARRHEAG